MVMIVSDLSVDRGEGIVIEWVIASRDRGSVAKEILGSPCLDNFVEIVCVVLARKCVRDHGCEL